LRHSWRGCGVGHDLRRPRRAGRLLQAGRALDVAGVTVKGVTVAIGSRHPGRADGAALDLPAAIGGGRSAGWASCGDVFMKSLCFFRTDVL
jgi:hypothetical protein